MDLSAPLHEFGTYRSSLLERVHWGKPARQVLPDELGLMRSRRAFVITNRSLRDTQALGAVVDAMGDRCAGVYAGVQAHSPRECVVEGAARARSAEADLLVAVGGGSVIDAAKGMLLCLRHGYATAEQLEPHANVRGPDPTRLPDDAALWKRMVALPTTLSGAEFAASAGITDTARRLKHAFTAPLQIPVAVILDPALTLATPVDLLRSTGMKAVDHAVERMTSAAANAYSDAVSEVALRMLHAGLLRLDEEPQDLEGRSRLQFAMFMSLRGAAAGVAVNVSHAIGHVLGAHGVPHGHTTGIVLPAVLRWSFDETRAAQQRIAAILGRTEGDAAAAVGGLVERLGLPRRLRETGVGRDDFDAIAAKALHESLLQNGRKKVPDAAEVRKILDLAW